MTTNGSAPSRIASWLKAQDYLHRLLDPDHKLSYRSKLFLMIAEAHPRGLDQAMLRRLEEPSNSVASKHIDEFEKQGLVEAFNHPSDGRKSLLRLTKEGEREKRRVVAILEGRDH